MTDKETMNPDWSLLEATQESLREHMAEIKRLQGLLEQQPADEPVACGYDETTGNCTQINCCYTHPPKRERVVFPTMLRKMWSGGEVQAWLDEHVNKEKNT